ncbi:MAG: hypothetical protein P4L67_03315 [Candidatus Pacebacteria bacterium]|nr:hypothetical protein [Candidatus Paceibacterota bacterium]
MKSSSTNRGDATLYWVFAYLSLFRLDELSHDDYKNLVRSQDPVKMNVFLQFLYSAEMLKQHVRPEWTKEYDTSYIDEKIIGGIMKNLSTVSDILASVEKKATGKVVQTTNLSGTASEMSETQEKLGEQDEKSKKVTVPKPFNITQPKPKKEKEVEPPIEPFHPQPVPDTIYTTTLEVVKNETQTRREDARKKTKEKYDKISKPFKFKTDERPMYKEKIKKDVEGERQKLLQFDKKYHEPPLDYKEVEAEVKLNAAAILREEFLLQKKNAEEEKRLKSYEVDLHNSGEFDRWQREMKEKDKIERMQDMQKRKLEMQMAREGAVESCQQKLKENQVLVEKVKMQSDVAMKEREEKKVEELQRKQNLRSDVLETKDNAAKEKQKVLDKNKQIREEVAKEIAEAMQRKREEQAIEQRRRDEIILKIRELETKPIERRTGFDPTETAGHGLIEEMSLAELRERLEMLKKHKADEEERNRQENMKKKEEYSKMIVEKSEHITAAREKKAKENERLRDERKRKEEEEKQRQQEIREKGLYQVHEKISEKKRAKRKEEERLAKELKEIKLQRQYLNENKAKIEEKAWKRLEIGAERKTRLVQNQKLVDQYGVETVKLKDTKLKAQAAKKAVMDRVEKNAQYETEYEEKIKENEELHKQDLLAKATKYAKQKEFETGLKTKLVQRNPYSMKVTMQTRKTAMKSTTQQKAGATTGEDAGELSPDDRIDDIDKKLIEEHKEEATANGAIAILPEVKVAEEDEEAEA